MLCFQRALARIRLFVGGLHLDGTSLRLRDMADQRFFENRKQSWNRPVNIALVCESCFRFLSAGGTLLESTTGAKICRDRLMIDVPDHQEFIAYFGSEEAAKARMAHLGWKDMLGGKFVCPVCAEDRQRQADGQLAHAGGNA